MQSVTRIITLMMAASAVQMLSAQELPNVPGPSKEHQWLQKFVGEWDVVSEGSAGEGQPPVKAKAVMKSSMLGNLWVVNASEMEVAGTTMKAIQMIGYDTKKKKYVGIWADSMMNHLWHYEGTVDKSGKKITLDAEGPSMTGDGKTAKYQDAYEFTDDGVFIATSSMQGPDGKWNVIMKGSASRRK